MCKSNFFEMFKVFKSSIYRVLWVSIIITTIGDNMGFLAILTILHDIFDEEIAVSYYIVMYNMAPIVLTYVTMVVVDKFDQRWTRLICSIIATIVTGSYLWAYYAGYIWMFYVAGGISAALQSFVNPAYNAYIAKVIDKKDLIHVNTINSITIKTFSIIMQGVGGIDVKYFGAAHCFAVVLGIYLLSDFVLSSLIWYKSFDKLYQESSGTESMRENKKKSSWNLFKESLVYMKDEPYIFHLVIIKGVVNMGMGAMVNYNYYYGFYKMKHWDSGALTIGIVSIVSSILSIVASTIANRVVGNSVRKMAIVIVVGALMVTGGVCFYAFAADIVMWCIGNSLLIAGNVVVYDMMITIIQKKVPDEKQGRVMSVSYNLRSMLMAVTVMTTGIVLTYYIEYAVMYGFILTGVIGLSAVHAIYGLVRNREFLSDKIITHSMQAYPESTHEELLYDQKFKTYDF